MFIMYQYDIDNTSCFLVDRVFDKVHWDLRDEHQRIKK